jgi:Rad3-related DNA helicase
MLNDVYNVFMAEYATEDMNVMVQTNSMKEADREEFLNQFEENGDKCLIGFCVMGGIFSEGIDLKNDRLIGTIVVGTGLLQVCNERELIAEYFNDKGMNGFDYSYKIPGMNKVLQAAGRVIRTMEDKGVIVLLDSRFMEYGYRSMYPKEWDDVKMVNVDNVKAIIKTIWDE